MNLEWVESGWPGEHARYRRLRGPGLGSYSSLKSEMERIHVIVELRWLSVAAGGIAGPVCGRLSLPAIFADDQSGIWWTVFVYLSEAVHGGDTVTAKIAIGIQGQVSKLLYPGACFELKNGPRTVATGRVLSLVSDTEVDPGSQ